MNNNQDELLHELDYIRQTIMLKQDHVTYLKTIDPDNMSKAVRVVIDNYTKQSKIMKMERHLLFIMVLFIFILGLYQIWIL